MSKILPQLKKYLKRSRKNNCPLEDQLFQHIYERWDKIVKQLRLRNLNFAINVLMLPIIKIAVKKTKSEHMQGGLLFNKMCKKNHRLVTNLAKKILRHYLPLTRAQYKKSFGNICPTCKSSFVYSFPQQGNNMKITEGQVIIDYVCDECGEEWEEVYKLDNYRFKTEICS